MDKYFYIIFFCSLLRLSLQVQGRVGYTAAAVEFSPKKTDQNIKEYVQFIQEAAKKSADVIAFPEGTLTAREYKSLQLVPSPEEGIVPYKNESYAKYKAVSAMSEAAARNKIYVVVNLLERVNCVNGSQDCPDRGYFLYNTNVAFDRRGTVVARYRKFNLYSEGTDKPKTAELSTFTTDFGVTFGMFICFDILFKAPTIDLVQKKNVTNLIFSTFWFGELPFLTAAQMQSGWSYSMDVNLLASGANNPRIGSTGTGIYLGRKSRVTYMVETGSQTMMIGRVNGSKSSDAIRTNKLLTARNGLRLKQDPSVSESRGENLNFDAGTFAREICYGKLCCRFCAKYRKASGADSGNYTYRAVAFQDKRFYEETTRHDAAYCAILLCTDGNCAKKPPNGDYPLIFDEIKIDAEFPEKNTFQMPSTLIWKDNRDMYLHTMDYDRFKYEKKKISGTDRVKVSIELNGRNAGNVITFGIYARDFN